MATASFGWPVTVNPDWGVKNLEYALDHPLDISKYVERARKNFRECTDEDIDRIVEKYLNKK